MATTRLIITVQRVPTLAARSVLTAAVVTRAALDTGDQFVTMRVMQGVKDTRVILMMGVVHADQDFMAVVAINVVLHIVLIAHVLLMMDRASVFKDIMVNVVRERARTLAKPAKMNYCVPCALLVDTDHCVYLIATVTAVHVIS